MFLVPPGHQSKRRAALREWYIRAAKAKILQRVAEQAHALGVSFDKRKSSTIATVGVMHRRRQRAFQLAADQGSDVRHRLRHRSRTRSSARSESHRGVLEHRPRENAYCGESKKLAQGTRPGLGRRNLTVSGRC